MPEVNNNELHDGTYLTKAEVAKRFRVSRRSIEIWVGENKFPAPRMFTKRKGMWHIDDILAHEEKVRVASFGA